MPVVIRTFESSKRLKTRIEPADARGREGEGVRERPHGQEEVVGVKIKYERREEGQDDASFVRARRVKPLSAVRTRRARVCTVLGVTRSAQLRAAPLRRTQRSHDAGRNPEASRSVASDQRRGPGGLPADRPSLVITRRTLEKPAGRQCPPQSPPCPVDDVRRGL